MSVLRQFQGETFAASPIPFSPFSSSSSNLKFRGTVYESDSANESKFGIRGLTLRHRSWWSWMTPIAQSALHLQHMVLVLSAEALAATSARLDSTLSDRLGSRNDRWRRG